ncbi:putative NAD(P)-binding-domain-containing protein [Rhodocollybia butyracea]|uniref:precorrin-2 dehydrogenase n=1 Tax=Rhodocollybia butyracea TaxID=206335 RepID=A0A9P5Q5L4_9AGAR|nr:putative NAD(P)-binding-domain-containing protein [Rhodocollybia butyracea]
MQSFSEIDNLSPGGGSLMIAWQLKGKRVLLVGGGEVASTRVEHLLGADAHITILCPERGLHLTTKRYIDAYPSRIVYFDRRFTGPSELHKIDLVLTAIDSPATSREIVDLCRKAKIPVNAADIPELCDFYFGAHIRDGPLQIMISSNGNGPRVSAIIKDKVRASLGGHEGLAISKLGLLRSRLKERVPEVGGSVGRKRMRWMTKICNEWLLKDFTFLDDAMIQKLLDDGWEQNRTPTFEEVSGKPSTSPSEDTASQPERASKSPVFGSQYLISIANFAAGAAVMAAFMYARRR